MRARHPSSTVAEARSVRFLLQGQLLHAGAAVLLAVTAWALAAPALGDGAWVGVADGAWFWSVVGVSVLHQAYVWLAWRGQLGWGIFTRAFGVSVGIETVRQQAI